MKLKNIFEKTKHFVDRNFVFVLTMLLLNLTGLTLFHSIGRAIHYFLYICFTISCVTALTELIPWLGLRSIVRRILVGASVFLLITDLYFAYFYDGFPDQAIMEILIATTPDEMWDYAKANLMNQWIILAVLVGAGLLYIVILQIYRLKKLRYTISVISVCIMFASLFTMANIVKDVFKHKDKTLKSLTYECCSVLRTSMQLYDGYRNLQHFERMIRSGNTRPRILYDESSIPYVVYILGESTSRHHLSIYDYRLNTTPYMSERERKGELIKFTDVISPNAHTMEVLGKLFTFYRQGAKGNWFQYTDLFSIVNEAGYHTVWISNQEYSGIYGNNGRVYAERCDDKEFTRYRSSGSVTIDAPYDEAVLPLLDKCLKKCGKKNFIVVHLLGTHQHYRHRYPETFKSFDAKDETGENKEIRQTRAEYDTAVRYNDSIMNAIIQRFENKNAIVVYASDHGEDVQEINKKIAGHSDLGINRRMVEIPMMIYTSKKFRVAYPALTQRMEKAAHRPFMTDDMIHTLLDIMKIKTLEFKPERSVINPHFHALRIRYCGQKVYKNKSTSSRK